MNIRHARDAGKRSRPLYRNSVCIEIVYSLYILHKCAGELMHRTILVCPPMDLWYELTGQCEPTGADAFTGEEFISQCT